MRRMAKSTYVANVTVFDGSRVRKRQGVLFGTEGIEWIGAHSRPPKAAREAREVDGDGKTLMPGLIDVHVHLQFDGDADFEKEARDLTTPGFAALKAMINAKRNLDAGVTTVRDLGGMGGASIDVAKAVAAGLVPGPRILAAGRALTVTGGHGHSIAFSREVDGPDAVRAAVREEIRAGATAIKLIATGGVLTPGIPATFSAFTAEELEAGVREAHERNLSVAAHAIGANGIRAAVLAGVDSIEHCNQLTAATAREMVARGTFRSPTICAVRGILDHADRVAEYAVEKARSIEADSKKSLRTAVRTRVRPVCGTDAGTPFNAHGNAPQEVVYMTEWGMPPLDALRAATANGAELLRLEDVGTIEVGKRADLVLVDERSRRGSACVARTEARVARRRSCLAVAQHAMEHVDALAEGGEIAGGEGLERAPKGLEAFGPSPTERACAGRRRAHPDRPGVVRVGLADGEPVPHEPVHELGHRRWLHLLDPRELPDALRAGEDQDRENGEARGGDAQRLVLHAQATQQVDGGRVQPVGDPAHLAHLSRRGSPP